MNRQIPAVFGVAAIIPAIGPEESLSLCARSLVQGAGGASLEPCFVVPESQPVLLSGVGVLMRSAERKQA